MEAKVYNQSGKETGTVTLPETVFGLPWNADLVHQVMVGMQANARTPVAHTHDRGEQRGGGKKPWRQKGTGSARHGSRRSPIWRGGGVTFGPRNDKDYSKKINKKMRTKALYTVLSQKMKDNEIIFVDDLKFETPKTKDAIAVLSALGKGANQEMVATKKRNAAYIATSGKDMVLERSFQNIGSVEVDEARNINAVDLLKYKYLVVEEPKTFIEGLEAKTK